MTEERVLPHLYMTSLVDMPAHTLSTWQLSPLKRIHVHTEWKCVAFIVPTPSSALVLHFSRKTQSRTVRHDAWEGVRMDAPLFSPVLTSFFPSLVGTFSTGSKPTGWLVCVHGVLLSPLPLGIEPKVLFIRCLESPHPSQIPMHSPCLQSVPPSFGT